MGYITACADIILPLAYNDCKYVPPYELITTPRTDQSIEKGLRGDDFFYSRTVKSVHISAIRYSEYAYLSAHHCLDPALLA